MRLFQKILLTVLAVSNLGVLCAAEENNDALIYRARDAGSFTVSASGTSGALLSQDTASGKGSHIGRYTLVASEIINPDLSITHGSYLLTTANGSTLSGTYAGQGSPGKTAGVITWEVCGPITGGTGRFQKASGMVCFAGTGDIQTGLFTENSVGVIFSDK